jgi:adenylate kinase
MTKVIVVAGPPGSGKNTQADFISQEFGFPHFDTGDILRRLKREGAIKDNEMEKGNLMDPTVVREIFKREIKELTKSGPGGVVLTGTLRTAEESFGSFGEEGLIQWLENNYGRSNLLFLIIDISTAESIKRNSIRNEGRPDDDPEIIKVRLAEYDNKTKPVFQRLSREGYKVIIVDGMPDRATIFEDIKDHLRQWL